MFSIHHDITIKSSAEKIFNAITTSEGLDAWWTKQSSGSPTMGAEYRFYFTKGYDWFAKVLLVTPNKQIMFKMISADEDWMDTLLTFTIIKKENNTCLLRFDHTEWRSINDHFRRTSYCWAIYLRGIKKYLEEGLITPYGKRTSV